MLCRYGDHAPEEMQSALRGASTVLVIVTANFLCSKFCLKELHWACAEMRTSQLAPQGKQPAGVLQLVPIFYHDQDELIGFGVDKFERSALQELLRQHHAAASDVDRRQWLDALMDLKLRTGIRQDTTGR